MMPFTGWPLLSEFQSYSTLALSSAAVVIKEISAPVSAHAPRASPSLRVTMLNCSGERLGGLASTAETLDGLVRGTVVSS